MTVKVINKSNNELPSYSTLYSAGMDLRANLEKDGEEWYEVLKPLERKIIPTGLFIELPKGNEAQIRPRSGLAVKKGLTVLNAPGTIDADYRGEVGVILINLSNEKVTIQHGERIAQMVVAYHEQATWLPIDKLNDTERGDGGFGHTGTN